jgi:hypothetical protein
MGKKRHFSILFSFLLEVSKTSKEKSKYYFFIFSYSYSSSVGNALNTS